MFTANETHRIWTGIVTGIVIDNRRRQYLAKRNRQAKQTKAVRMKTAFGVYMMLVPNGLVYRAGKFHGPRAAWDRLQAHRVRVQADLASGVE